MVLAFGKKGYLYFIIIHGMGRIAFGYEYGFASAFGDKWVLSIAFPLESPCHLDTVIVEFVFVFIDFRYVVVCQHIRENIHAQHFQGMCGKV